MKHKKHWILLLLGVIFILGGLFFITQNSSVLADSGFDADWGGGSSSSGGSSWGGFVGDDFTVIFLPRFSATQLHTIFDLIFAKFNIVEAILLSCFALIYNFLGMWSYLMLYIILFTMVHKTINRLIKFYEYKVSVLKVKKSRKNNIFAHKKSFFDSAFKIYKNIQIARMNFDYETLKKYTTNELFNEMKTQLQKLEASKQQNIIEDIQCQQISTVEKSVIENGVEKRSATLIITCKDYLIDQNTKQVVRGSKDETVQYDYKLTFIQGTKCHKCGKIMTKKKHTCENCGAFIINRKSSLFLCEKETLYKNILNSEENK